MREQSKMGEAAAMIIVEELRRGREWAVQLQGCCGGGGKINNDELFPRLHHHHQQQLLLQKIISSLDKSITALLMIIINFNLSIHHHQHNDHTTPLPPLIPIPCSSTPPPPPPFMMMMMSTTTTTSSSTPPQLSHHNSPNLSCHTGRVFKKRKTSGGTQQVRVRPATGLGGGLDDDDGHSWRKYGQKDILGANHPRAYYRCTHRHMQGCMAKKHIQRSDADPSIFEVTYKGTHTCTASSSSSSSSMSSAKSGSPNEAQLLLHQQLQKQDDEKHGFLLPNNYGLTQTDLFDVVDIASDDIFPPFVSPASSDDSTMNLPFLLDQIDDYGFDELTQFMDRPESDSVTNSPLADWHLPPTAAAADDHQALNLDAVIDILEYFS